MTNIFNTGTKEVTSLAVVSDGMDFLSDVIGGCYFADEVTTEDMPEGCDFAMTDEDVRWWTRWAEREQAIIDAANEIGEEAIEGITRLSMQYSDFEELQYAEEKFLGLA